MTNTNFCDDYTCRYYKPEPREANCGHDPPFTDNTVLDGFYSCYYHEYNPRWRSND